MPGTVIQGLFPHGLTRIASPGAPMRPSPNGTAVPLPQKIHVSNHGGQPLTPEVLQRMEAAFATNFRDVRVHVGPEASSLGAVAFAHGSHVYFAPGQYEPSLPRGLRVLGHELAHVVQQRAGRVANPFGSGIAVVQNRTLEAEADRMAERAAIAIQRAEPVQRKTAWHVPQHHAAPQPQRAIVQRQPALHVSAPAKVGDGKYRIAARAGGAEAGSVMVHASRRGEIVVTDLGVSPEHRKQGVGNALIASACRAGMQLGKSKVVLSSQDDGSGRLTQWYQRMGFAPSGHDQRGMVRLEAPISRVIAGAAQAKMDLRVVQRANLNQIRPNSPRAHSINHASGSNWDSMNTTSTIEFDPPHPEYGSMAVFSLAYNADRSDEANRLGYETITYRQKSDRHLHSEMLIVADYLEGKVDLDHIRSWGVSRNLCRYCGIVMNHLGVNAPYDPNYYPTNWTNPWKNAGLAKHNSPPGVPWQ
jgi:ribosomal protein S18 acetylase RimI-like enzyme